MKDLQRLCTIKGNSNGNLNVDRQIDKHKLMNN